MITMSNPSSAVIFNTDTGRIVGEYRTMAAAKAAYTRAAKSKIAGEDMIFQSPSGRRVVSADEAPLLAVMDKATWDREINREYAGAKGYKVKLDTPISCDPNSESYWSM